MHFSRRVRISLFIAAGVLLCLSATLVVLIIRFRPAARSYVLSALRERYHSDVELGDLQISLFPTVQATGTNLVLHLSKRKDVGPMVRVSRFTLDANLAGFFRHPKRIRRLRLEGMKIRIPPHSDDNGTPGEQPKMPFVLDEVIADGTVLETLPKDPSKDPLVFNIRRLNMKSVGLGQPMTFRAQLDNPKPPGAIQSEGKFGPWNADEPAATPVSGHYTFRNADLGVFHGIAGTLSSDGTYDGELDRIEVRGTTDTPNFMLSTADRPIPLHTDFEATVDGTDGGTLLHPVRARLGSSTFEVSGSIDRNALETHKTIELRAQTGKARLEDFLRLSVKAKPPMTGQIAFDTKVKIPPGKTEVVTRLELNGVFSLNDVRFTSKDVAGKIAGLSHRAQGDPKDTDPNVESDFKGRFYLRGGLLTLPDLQFTLPGADVRLRGTYALKSGKLDFDGTARVDATVSQMTTGIKRVLLKPVDPLFRRDGAGAVLPIEINGTRGDPSFRLNIGRVLKRK